jgi:hypothetical protein
VPDLFRSILYKSYLFRLVRFGVELVDLCFVLVLVDWVRSGAALQIKLRATDGNKTRPALPYSHPGGNKLLIDLCFVFT